MKPSAVPKSSAKVAKKKPAKKPSRRKPKAETVTIAESKPIIPIHQWTHDIGRVWIVKCVNLDGTSYDGFTWPESGAVKPTKCSRAPDCESGGFFGWAWGMRLGVGKESNYRAKWLVFSAPPEQVIEVEGKVKVAADTPEQVDCRVEFCGQWWDAMSKCHAGQMAWIAQAAKGSAAATGESGSAAATGWRGRSDRLEGWLTKLFGLLISVQCFCIGGLTTTARHRTPY